MLSHFHGRARRFGRMNPVLPADAARRLAAEDEMYNKIEDLGYLMLHPMNSTELPFLSIWVGPGHTPPPRRGSLKYLLT